MAKKPRCDDGPIREVGALGMVLPIKRSFVAKVDDELEATARVATVPSLGGADNMRPLWDAHASASTGRDRSVSPTSVIPLQDFDWATAPIYFIYEHTSFVYVSMLIPLVLVCLY